MANAIASLVVSLGLDASKYVAGFELSERQAKKFARTVEQDIQKSGRVLAAGAAAATAFAVAFDRSISGVANYKDISEQIGDTAEAVAGLQLAADRSGRGLDVVSAASVKMTKNLSGVIKESEGVGAALKALGLDAEQFRRLAPVEQLQKLADASASFKDSPSKTSALETLLGKSAKEVIPFLNDLAEVKTKARFTQEEIERADSMEKELAQMKGEARDLARAFMVDLVPAVAEVIKKFKEGKESGGWIKGLFTSTGQSMVEGARLLDQSDAKRNLEEINAQLENTRDLLDKKNVFPRNSFLSDLNLSFGDSRDPQKLALHYEKLLKARAAFQAQLAATEQRKPLTGTGEEQKPTVKFDLEALAKASAMEKRSIEMARAAAENRLSFERETQQAALQLLDQYNSQGLLSIQEYYERRKSIVEAGAAAEQSAISEQIAIQQKAASDAAKDKEWEKETSALVQISKLRKESAQVQRSASQQMLLDSFRMTEEERRYAESVKETTASILEMTGKTAEAVQLRQEMANFNKRRSFAAAGDQNALAALRQQEELTVAAAAFGQQQQRNSEAASRLGIEEERIQNSLRVGAISQIEAMNRTSEARRRAIAEQELIVEALERTAAASQNPALILQAEQARASIERLRTEADLLAQTFDTVFKDSAADALTDFITRTKSAKDAALDFVSSVSRAITRLAADDLAKGLMSNFGGGSGGASGLGTWLAGLFGSRGGGNLATNWLGAPEFAVGTDFLPRTGLVFAHRGETITPANQNSGGGVQVVMNISTPDVNSFNRSSGQITTMLARRLGAAQRNM